MCPRPIAALALVVAGLLAADRADGGFFGRSVAVSGDTVLVAAAGAADDFFGSSVAVSGETAFVGAPDQRVGAKAKGSAYVFARAAGVWSQEQELTASDGSVGRPGGRLRLREEHERLEPPAEDRGLRRPQLRPVRKISHGLG